MIRSGLRGAMARPAQPAPLAPMASEASEAPSRGPGVPAAELVVTAAVQREVRTQVAPAGTLGQRVNRKQALAAAPPLLGTRA